MMTLGNLIENLEANNIPYYVQDGHYPDRVQIGVPTLGGDVYYWYEFWMSDGAEVQPDDYISFVQRYNRATGTRLCSYKTRDNFENIIRTRDIKKLLKRGDFDIVMRCKSSGLGNHFLISNRA